MTDDVVSALLRALERAPDDDTLRLHAAELLMQSGRTSEAIVHLGMLLAADPRHPRAAVLMASALSGAPSVEHSETPRQETGASFDWDAAEGDVGDIVALGAGSRGRPDSRHPLICRKLVGGDVSERPKVQLSKSCVG